jgi:large subunit ribosomal protein L5
LSAEEVHKKWLTNLMLKPRLEKVTVNMAVGKSGEPLEKAVRVLEQLTGQKPLSSKAKKSVRDFGIRKGESIACLVTLRKAKTREFLKKAFEAVDNKISRGNFDQVGNFSFGIKEHIDIPGTKYVPELGIHGMDVCVTLARSGQRVKRRHRAKSKVGAKQILTPEEAMVFVKEEFGVEIT